MEFVIPVGTIFPDQKFARAHIGVHTVLPRQTQLSSDILGSAVSRGFGRVLFHLVSVVHLTAH